MDKIQANNRCISSPGIAAHGAASALVKYSNSFQFLANGLVSPVVTTLDAPSLALATRNVPGATVVGDLLPDNGSVNTGIKCCRIFTLVATLPTNDGSTVPTFSWLAGDTFTKYEFPSTQYMALPNQSNQTAVGFVMVKNAGAVNFTPGTTNLDAANVTTSFLEYSLNLGVAATLASGQFFVGNGANSATGVAMSGEATLANTGAVTLADTVKVYTSKVTLTSLQILSLNSTPISLLAAPGTGKVYQILSVYGRINFATAAYAANTNLQIVDTTTGNALFSDASALLASASTVIAMIPQVTASATVPVGVIVTTNGAVSAKAKTGDPTTGAGTVDVYLQYKIITL